MLLQAFSLGLSVIGLLPMWLIGHKARSGWLVGILIQLVWIPYDIATRQYAFVATGCVSIAVYWRGWHKHHHPPRRAPARHRLTRRSPKHEADHRPDRPVHAH